MDKVNKEKYRRQRGKPMSLYDEKQLVDKTKTWNKWRILMKNKSLLCFLMILIMVIAGSITNVVHAAYDYEAFTFSDGGGFPGHTLAGTGIDYGGDRGTGVPGTYTAWSDVYYNNVSITVIDQTTGATIGSGKYEASYTTVAGHDYLIIFENPNTTYYIYGSTEIPTADRNYTISGSNYYKTLAEAVAAASSGNTIKVLKSHTDSSSVTLSKNITLNTNGYTITKSSYGITVNSGYTLSITGSGKITTSASKHLITNRGTLNLSSATLARTGNNTSYYPILNYGTCTINSGTVSAVYIAINNDGGTVNVKGGTVKATGDSGGALKSAITVGIYSWYGTLNISGGTISATNYGSGAGTRGISGDGHKCTISGGTITASAPNNAIAVEIWANSAGVTSSITVSGSPTISATTTEANGYIRAISIGCDSSSYTHASTLSISGGSITAQNSAGCTSSCGVYVEGSTANMTVTGGTITGSAYGFYEISSSGKLTIGSSTAVLSATSPSISGGTYGVYSTDGFNFYNGVIKGTNSTPYSGTATPRSGSDIITVGPTNTLYSSYLSASRNYQVGSKYYEKLSDAVASASAGNTILVLKSNTDTSTAIIDKNLTIDTNGNTITRNANTTTVKTGATLTLIGSGGITVSQNLSDWAYAIKGETGSVINFTSGTISASNSLTTSYGAIGIGSLGTINITGGTITTSGCNTTAAEIVSNSVDITGSMNISGSPTLTATGIAEGKGVAIRGSYNTGANIITAPVTISGGTITGTASSGSGWGLRNYDNDGNINITGGTITGSTFGIYNGINTGITSVTGGSIKGSTAGIYLEAGNGSLNFGDSAATLSTTSPSASGGTDGINSANGFNFYNGIIKGTNATPYAGTANIRTGHEGIIEGPVNGLYSAYLAKYDNYVVNGSIYSTLTNAIAAANDGDEITVIRTNTDPSKAIINKNIILNTNGYTITKSVNPITINYGCELDIKGNGTITGASGINTIVNNGVFSISETTMNNESTNMTNVLNNASGVVTVNSGTIKTKFIGINNYGVAYIKGGNIECNYSSAENIYGVYTRTGSKLNMTAGNIVCENTSTNGGGRGINSNGGDVTISGGTITVSAYTAYAVRLYSADCSLKISGNPTISSVSNYTDGPAIAIAFGENNQSYISVNVNISGGTITATGTTESKAMALCNRKNNVGIIKINGGQFTSNGRAINMDSDLNNLIIGDKDAPLNKNNPMIQGGTEGVYTPGSFEFYNGIIKGTTSTPYAGTPITKGEYYKVITEGPDSNGIYSSYIDFTPKYQIKETENYYDTLEEAILDATNGQTIVVIGDCIDSSNAIINKDLTLDTNGHTITKNNYSIFIENGSTLNIIGDGTLTASSKTVLVNSGNLILNDAKVINTSELFSNRAIDNDAEGTFTMNSGTVNAKVWAIYNYGEITVNGGEIKAENSIDDFVRAVHQDEFSSITVNGGILSGINNSTSTIYGGRAISGYGDITIKGGTFTGIGVASIAVEIYCDIPGAKANVNISGTPTLTATSISDSGYARAISVSGASKNIINVTTVISGGTFNASPQTGAKARAIHVSGNSGTTTIKGGTISSTGYGIYIGQGSGRLTYGDKMVKLSQSGPIVTGVTYGIYAPDGFDFYNGIIKSEANTVYYGTANPRELHSIKIDGPDAGVYTAYLNQNESIYESEAYLAETIFRYDGTAKEPEAIVALNGKQLNPGTDYEITYKNNIEVGVATAVVTGIGEYGGVISLNFIISNTEIDSDQIILDLNAPVITIKDIKLTSTTITFDADARDLQLGDNIPGSGVNKESIRYLIKTEATVPAEDDADWQISNEFENKNSGTMFIWVKVADNVGNVGMQVTEITSQNFKVLDLTYSLSPDTYEYDGTAKTPTVTVASGAIPLVQGTDYEVEYHNNVEVGVATVYVYGIGEYEGSQELFFTITDTTKPTAPAIDAKLSSYSGTTYTPGTLTNKNVFIELTSTDANKIDVYEWSTNGTDNFTSDNIVMVDGVGRIRFDKEMNQTIFFRSKDNAGNYSNVSSIVIRIDKTAPIGSIDVQEKYLKDGEKYVDNNTVTINVLASDDISTENNIKVAFINEDEFSLSKANSSITWLDYSTTKNWTSSEGDGYKKVYVIFKDEAGNQSVYLAENGEEVPQIFTITYNANGGELGNVPGSEIKFSNKSYSITLKEPTKEGFTFLGWATSSDATGGEYLAGDTFDVSSNVTLYAVWIESDEDLPLLADMVNVGDFVDYKPDVATYQTVAENTGSVSVSLTTDSNLKWRVIHIDEETGEVMLTTEGVAHPEEITLSGAEGFVNGSTELHNISAALYSNQTTIGVTAKSMTLEDINKATGYIPQASTVKYAYYPVGTTGLSGTTDDGYTKTAHDRMSVSSTWIESRFYAWDDSNGNTYISKNIQNYKVPSTNNPVKLTYTYYSYNPNGINSIIGDILGDNKGWLATSCVGAFSTNVGFNIYQLYNEGLGSNSVYNSNGVFYTPSYGLRPVVTLPGNILITGKDENDVWKIKENEEIGVYATLYTDGTLGFSHDTSIIERKTVSKTYGNVANIEFASPSEVPWNSDVNSIKTVTFANEVSPISLDFWFNNCTNLTTINNITNLNTSNVTSMYCTFCNCTSMNTLDLSSFDTSNVTFMGNTFQNCFALTDLNLSGWDTSNVTYMRSMFDACGVLTTLDLSSFNTSNVTNMYAMFIDCSSLDRIYVGLDWTTNNADTSYMFDRCGTKHACLIPTAVYVTLYTDGTLGFSHDTSTIAGKTVSKSYGNISNADYNSGSEVPWANDTTLITTAEFVNKVSPAIEATFWFNNCSNLTNIKNIENLHTCNVINIGGLFSGCSKLTTLDLSNFDTRNVIGMGNLFQNCTSLTSVDLSGWDTNNVTYMRSMFDTCSVLTTLDLTDFDTSNTTNMMYMFINCSSLNSIYVSDKWNTANADVTGMFYRCNISTVTRK